MSKKLEIRPNAPSARLENRGLISNPSARLVDVGHTQNIQINLPLSKINRLIVPLLLLANLLHYTRRYTSHDRVCWHIAGDDGTGGDYGTASYAHTVSQNGS